MTTTRARSCRFAIAVVTTALAVPMTALTGAAAEAEVVTCQGQPATVVGPTNGQDTTGTDGDDVIVAPLSSNSFVEALGGDDTLCLVDGPTTPSRDAIVNIRAGGGADTVVNETTHAPGEVRVELGAGADSYTGTDYRETVYGSVSSDAAGPDTEVDAFDMGGGDDDITSGTPNPGWDNHDVIATGSGRDSVRYGGLAGESIDNGGGADTLVVVDSWAGELSIDNTAQHAILGNSTALTWTNVDWFALRAVPGSHATFVGSDAGERLSISGTVLDLTVPATITTGGGDDDVRLENYLPTSVDLGGGFDVLSYLACDEATIVLAGAAQCTTFDDRNVVTSVSGVDYLFAKTVSSLTVLGTPGDERIEASSRHVLVLAGRGGDRVIAEGRTAKVLGGRGDDRLRGFGRRGVTVLGGPGSDVMRGGAGPDELYGGRGADKAYGQRGSDLCVAEVRVACERP